MEPDVIWWFKGPHVCYDHHFDTALGSRVLWTSCARSGHHNRIGSDWELRHWCCTNLSTGQHRARLQRCLQHQYRNGLDLVGNHNVGSAVYRILLRRSGSDAPFAGAGVRFYHPIAWQYPQLASEQGVEFQTQAAAGSIAHVG